MYLLCSNIRRVVWTIELPARIARTIQKGLKLQNELPYLVIDSVTYMFSGIALLAEDKTGNLQTFTPS